MSSVVTPLWSLPNREAAHLFLWLVFGVTTLLPQHSCHQYNHYTIENKGNNKNFPNSEQSYKGKIKTHKYINRQNQSTTGKL
jgi:hypothetical protein